MEEVEGGLQIQPGGAPGTGRSQCRTVHNSQADSNTRWKRVWCWTGRHLTPPSPAPPLPERRRDTGNLLHTAKTGSDRTCAGFSSGRSWMGPW